MFIYLSHLRKAVIKVRFLPKLLDEKTSSCIKNNKLNYNLIPLFGTQKSTLNNNINQSCCF